MHRASFFFGKASPKNDDKKKDTNNASAQSPPAKDINNSESKSKLKNLLKINFRSENEEPQQSPMDFRRIKSARSLRSNTTIGTTSNDSSPVQTPKTASNSKPNSPDNIEDSSQQSPHERLEAQFNVVDQLQLPQLASEANPISPRKPEEAVDLVAKDRKDKPSTPQPDDDEKPTITREFTITLESPATTSPSDSNNNGSSAITSPLSPREQQAAPKKEVKTRDRDQVGKIPFEAAKKIVARTMFRNVMMKRFRNYVSNSPELKRARLRRSIIMELLSTEQSYCNHLKICINDYHHQIKKRGLLTEDECTTIFSNSTFFPPIS